MARRTTPARRWLTTTLAAVALTLAPAVVSLPTTIAHAADLGPACPENAAKRIYVSTDFESALPAELTTQGMQIVERPDAASGTHVLLSTVDSATWQHVIGTSALTVPFGVDLRVSFASRGTFSASKVMHGAELADRGRTNDLGFVAPPAVDAQSTWQNTSARLPLYRYAPVKWGLFHTDFGRTATGETLEIDDLQVYACVPITPASGVRGDVTGDGRADYLFLTKDGTLTESGMAVSAALGRLTWVGYPGDVDGDKRTDYLVRQEDGRLQILTGTPAIPPVLSAPRTIGVGWQGMTALIAIGDVNGDGLSDVLARAPNGDLLRYSIAKDGKSMFGGWRIGTGWNMFTMIASVGDQTGDGRPDIVGILPNGDMLLYPTSANGGFVGTSRRIGTGWNMFVRITNQGDFDGDGHDDLLADMPPDAAGLTNEYTYLTDGAGGWRGIRGPGSFVSWNSALISDLSTTPFAADFSATEVIWSDAGAPRTVRPSSPAAATPPAVVLPPAGADCPAGSTKVRTLYTDDFETPVVYPGYRPFTTRVAPDAPQGTHVGFGRDGASLLAATPGWAPGLRTYARLWLRGNAMSGWSVQTMTSVPSTGPSQGWPVIPFLRETEWRDTVIDLTSADLVQTSQPRVRFDATGTNSLIEMDDLRIYQCTATTGTVRGDFDGDGYADLVSTSAGSPLLYMWPGGPGIGFAPPAWRISATGFGDRTWFGSPGDVTGDRKADLLSRDAAGTLWLHPGDGAGGFGTPIALGGGFGGMTSLTAMGDVNGDGRSDLYARDAVGDLYLYSLSPGGTSVSSGTKVGNGWNIMKHLFQVGDVTGDGRTDVVGVDAAGDMWAYETSAVAGFTGRRTKISTGWSGFARLTGPGDLDGDGLADVLAFRTDTGHGELYSRIGGTTFTSRPSEHPYPLFYSVGL